MSILLRVLQDVVLYACLVVGLCATLLGIVEWANRKGPRPVTVIVWALCVAYVTGYLLLR